ncbi:thiosulfate sulfurtransferase PspE [Phytobacter ursingii]
MLKQTVIAAALAASTPTIAAEHWIDVRIPEQYQREHIQGALNIPLSDIQAGTFSPLAKEDTLYLYCNSGRQATLAQDALQQMGYQHVINMGGIAGLNKPVVTSK